MYKTFTTGLTPVGKPYNRPVGVGNAFPPLVAGATTFPLQFGGAAKGKRLNGQARRLTSPHCGGPMQDLHSGTITRAYCRAIYEESVSRCFILPPEQGEVRRSRIGGRRAQRANQQNAY